MPSVDDIPQASQLSQRLDRLNTAIASLNAGGTVTNMTIAAPPPTDGSIPTITGIPLEPPISDPTTIASLTTALQAQADDVTSQLTALGFTPSTKAAA